MKAAHLSVAHIAEQLITHMNDVQLFRGRFARIPTKGQIVGLTSPEFRGFVQTLGQQLGLTVSDRTLVQVRDQLAFQCSSAALPPLTDIASLTETDLATEVCAQAQPLGFTFRPARYAQWVDRHGVIHVTAEPGCWLLKGEPDESLAIRRLISDVLAQFADKLDDPTEKASLKSAHKLKQILFLLEQMAAFDGDEPRVVVASETHEAKPSAPDDPFGAGSIFTPGWEDESCE